MTASANTRETRRILGTNRADIIYWVMAIVCRIIDFWEYVCDITDDHDIIFDHSNEISDTGQIPILLYQDNSVWVEEFFYVGPEPRMEIPADIHINQLVAKVASDLFPNEVDCRQRDPNVRGREWSPGNPSDIRKPDRKDRCQLLSCGKRPLLQGLRRRGKVYRKALSPTLKNR